MLRPPAALMRRVLAALDAAPSRVPVLLGGHGSGRSSALQQLRDRLGRTSVHCVDVERTATTPERFLRALAGTSPFPLAEGAASAGARAAFDAILAYFQRARTSGGAPATFLLDEFLEFRTFESFPGLRQALPELVEALAASGNRFVLSSRYTARTLRLLKDASARFEVVHVLPFTADETRDALGARADAPAAGHDHDAEFLAHTVHALSAGRPAYITAIADELAAMQDQGGSDALSALVALMSPGGRLATLCGYWYELRLHRARGYGALKAILEILADEEGLTLTEISQRMQRTPGSTKDYLSWLEDVDLITVRQKRYSFADPLLRLWVRLHCRVSAPSDDEVAREVHRYALPRLPHPAEPALAMATAPAAASPADEDRKAWGIIEID